MRIREKRLRCTCFSAFAALFCALLCAYMAGAQGSYSSTLWRTSSGLPENFVQAILAAGDQQLWIATTGGLSRFDGSTFTTLNEEQLAGVPVNSFSCLTRTRDGSLWAGTEGGGIVHITGSKAELFDSRSGLRDLYVRSIYEDSRGRLWVGTDGGLFLRHSNTFEPFHFGPRASEQDVFSITEDKHQDIFVGGSQFWRLGSTSSQPLRLSGADSQNLIKALLFAQDGALWVGTPTGLFRYVDKSFVRINNASVSSIIQGHDGTIWVGTYGRGLIEFPGGGLTPINIQNPQMRAVTSLLQDEDGRIWVGTRSGLVRLQRTSVQVLPLPIAGKVPGTISSSSRGDVFLAVDRVFEVSSGQSHLRQFPGLEQTYAMNILSGRDGSTWLGTLSNGVYHVTSGKIEHYSMRSAEPLTGDTPRGMLETQQRDLWVATGFGLNRIRNGSVTRYGTAEGLPSRNIRSLMEDRSHCLWIGTEAGLARMCGERLVQDAAIDALRGENIWAMLEDRKGALWFGTRDHGLYRFNGGQMLHLTTGDGLASNTVYGFLQDASGRFWMSSPETISSFSESDMERAKGDPDDFLAVTTYSMPQGFEGTQFPGGRFPSGCVARDNSVWFVSDQGAIHIAQLGNHSVHPPFPVITNVSVDGEPFPLTSGARMKSSSRRIRFEYAPRFLGPFNELQTMYRLAGLDSNWTTGSSTGNVEYGSLAPGKYRFEVKAFLRTRPSQYTMASFPLVSEPAWYKTRWAFALLFLAIFVCILAAYLFRLQRLRSRFRLVLEERGRLAREMHDTVIQGCNGVSMLLEAAASNDKFNSQSNLLALARSQIQATIAEAREAVWGLRKAEQDEGDFHETLHRLAQQSQEALGLSVMFAHRGKTAVFAPGTAHEFVMIAREAIANAGAHANPTRINLRTASSHSSFFMEIADDGCGFDPGESAGLHQGHYGLIGMRERAGKIHAKLSIFSSPGKGTRVVVEMPRS